MVDVINGGSECNVFWQIGSSATLGTGTAFAGSILALTSITSTTSVTLSGQLLARNGAVTLDTLSASLCTPTAPPPSPSIVAIPTLSEWALLLLASVLALLGFAVVRRSAG